MKKILLIEDDTVLRENTAELLGLFNFDVQTAENGKLGIECAKKELPDIVVCDIMMPEVDGYGVLDALSKDLTTKYIPFIFLSAKTERKDVRRGMDLGADDYITKPFAEEELVSAIESRLAKAAILKDVREIDQAKNKSVEPDNIRSLNELKNYFDDNGYEVRIFTFSEGDRYPLNKGIVRKRFHKKLPLFNYALVRALVYLIQFYRFKKNRPDIICSHINFMAAITVSTSS